MPLAGRLLNLLGQPVAASVLRSTVPRSARTTAYTVPRDIAEAGKVLIMLPAEPLDALHQLTTIISLIAHFRHASVDLFCAPAIVPYAGTIQGVGRLIECGNISDHPLSASMKRTAAGLRDAGYDVCVVLDRSAGPSLLWLAGQTGARIRAGFDACGAYPFINFRVRLSGRPLYRPDQNLFVARMLGAAPKQNSRWGVSKVAIEEAGRLLIEAGMAADAPLACFDGFSFCRRHGPEWTGAQMRRLSALGLSMCWLTTENAAPDEPTVALLRKERVPAFAGIPVAHAAALARRARVVIAGKSSLFEIAHLLDAPAIGIFDAWEAAAYCPSSARIRCICYDGAPDATTIEAVAAAVGPLSAVRSRY